MGDIGAKQTKLLQAVNVPSGTGEPNPRGLEGRVTRPDFHLDQTTSLSLNEGRSMKNFIRRLFGRREMELVPYYDPATKIVSRIPKAELRPGVVLVRIQGQPEAVYTDGSGIKLGPHQHVVLAEDVRVAITTLVSDLADVYPKTFEEWEDGFRRDRNPAREIAGWIHLSRILQVMTKRLGFSMDEKKECFRVLVACFTGARDTVRERSDPSLLPAPQVEQAIKFFYEGGYS